MRRLVSSRLAALVAGIAAIACAKEKPVEQPPAPAPPAAPNVVHVEAADYSFKAPDSIPSGVTTFHMMNGGKEAHQMMLVKAPYAAMQKMDPNAPPPADMVSVGGPNAAMPGGTAEVTLDLAPGDYTMLCFIPGADGKPHMLKGMMKGLTVTQGTSTAVLPTPDMTVKLTDYTFDMPDTVKAGHHVIRVENGGPQEHEMVFIKLDAGKKGMDFVKWTNGMKGAPPGSPVNGAGALSVGQSNSIQVDLTPGNYALICFVTDTKDKKPHFMHGMVKDITVN
jgi:hypothetical protein